MFKKILITLIGLNFLSVCYAQEEFGNFIEKLRKNKVTYNRDGSVTFKKLRAHNGTDTFPIRYETDLDYLMSCKMMGFDSFLPEPGLNNFLKSNNFKLMFNKGGSLEEHPVSEGFEISKLTCYRYGKIRSSVHAKVDVTDEGTTIFSDIYFLRGDLKYRIAFLENISVDENLNRLCRLLDKKFASISDDSLNVIIKKIGERVVLDDSPQFKRVQTALRFVSKVECFNEN